MSKVDDTYRIANLLISIREINDSDNVISILKDAVRLKWGSNDFPAGYNNDHLLAEALEHYLKVRRK